MADERATPLNQGFAKWLQITDGGKLQTWNGVDTPTPIIGDDPLVTKTELDDKASLSLNYGYVSEYTSRVMQEGGTIQNGRRTAAPFISPTYEDAKMILNASGGLDIAEVDGRKVVNKVWDSSQEKENPTFAGSDRPEFTDYNFESVDVEREATNYITESEGLDNWSAFDVNVNIINRSLNNHKIFELTNFIDSNSRIVRDITPPEGESTAHIWAKADEECEVRLRYDFEDYVITTTTEWQKFSFTALSPDGGGTFQIRAVSATLGRTIFVSQPQFETGEYATNYIPTQGSPVTRLAPITEVENALSETGTVAGVVDMVLSDASNYIFRTVGAGNSLFVIGADGGFQVRFFGSDLLTGDLFPGWDNFTRRRFAFTLTYDGGALNLFTIYNGEIQMFSRGITLGNDSNRDINLGVRSASDNPESIYFEKPWYKDNIVRVNATDEEIKQFFEDLVKGTSMEMSKEDMVIV